jgi:hypothetical protein
MACAVGQPSQRIHAGVTMKKDESEITAMRTLLAGTQFTGRLLGVANGASQATVSPRKNVLAKRTAVEQKLPPLRAYSSCRWERDFLFLPGQAPGS